MIERSGISKYIPTIMNILESVLKTFVCSYNIIDIDIVL